MRIASIWAAWALALSTCLSATAQSLLDAPELDARGAYLQEMKAPLSFFKSGRLISFQTAETEPQGQLNFRVAHRFGNIATPGTTYHTLFGLDQVADIWLGLDYGLTDRWQVGIARAKGAGPLNELWTASTKLRLPGDELAGMPIRLAVAANATYSTQTADPFVPGKELSAGPFARRGTYFAQFLAAAVPTERLVVQLAPAWVWRNYVAPGDANGLLFLPLSARLKVSKRFSLTAEYAPLLAASGTEFRGGTTFWKNSVSTWYAPLNLGLEMETGGHVFQISLSNTGGLLENDMLPYNPYAWEKGAFRMGFAILRGFQVGKRRG